MRSSTSSSKLDAPFTRAPDLSWRGIIGWTLVLALASLATAEVTLRRAGFQPTIQDSQTLWAQQRARLDAGPSNQVVVFIGRSRIMQAMDRETLVARFPALTYLQLATAGLDRHPLAVLQDIAERSDFNGLAVVSVTEDSFERKNWGAQQDLVEYYHHKFRLNESINERLSVFVQSHFAVVRPEVSITSLATTVLRSGFAPTPGVEMDAFRFRNTDFRDTAFARQRLRNVRQQLNDQIAEVKSGLVEKPDSQAWLLEALEVEQWVKRIQSRGGRVVYLRMPTSGERLQLGDLLYPRDRFWNVFASRTAAATVHFADYETLSGFELPDLSHIRGDDRERFTDALMDILSEKRLMMLPGP